MWEYTIAELPKWPAPLEEALNERAKANWELVTLYESPQAQVAIGGTVLVGVFRRMKMSTCGYADPSTFFVPPVNQSILDKPVVTAIDSTPVVSIQEPQQ